MHGRARTSCYGFGVLAHPTAAPAPSVFGGGGADICVIAFADLVVCDSYEERLEECVHSIIEDLSIGTGEILFVGLRTLWPNRARLCQKRPERAPVAADLAQSGGLARSGKCSFCDMRTETVPRRRMDMTSLYMMK